MFPVFGIIAAAVLFFKLKSKSTANSPSTTTTSPVPVKPTIVPHTTVPVKPRTTAPVKPRTTTGTGPVEGWNLPYVLSPMLPAGQYNPKTNSVETPPIVAWNNGLLNF